MLVISEGVERVMGVNQLLPAVGTAAAISLIFRPLQRLGAETADRLMPGVRDDDDYRSVRKQQVYEAALAAAIRDGRLGEREREALATLAQELGMTAPAQPGPPRPV